MRVIATNCHNLKSFTYKLESFGCYSRLFDGLSDNGILALVRGCRKLESLELINAKRVKAACFVTIRDTVAADENAYALRSIKVTVKFNVDIKSRLLHGACLTYRPLNTSGAQLYGHGLSLCCWGCSWRSGRPAHANGRCSYVQPGFLYDVRCAGGWNSILIGDDY